MIRIVKYKLIRLVIYFEKFFSGAGLLKIAKLFSFLKKKISELFDFCLYSLSGLIMDLLMFAFLVHILSIRVFFANLVSVYSAATIGYFILGKRIFKKLTFGKKKYCYYIIYQIISTIFFSVIIDYLNSNFIKEPLVSKIIVVLITITCNYIFFITIFKDSQNKV